MELMVVISIIALLLSMTTPQLIKAREQAQRIECQSNIRNLTFAWLQYSIDNQDLLCSANTWWNIGGENNWVADGPDLPGNPFGGTEQAIKDGALWRYTTMIGIYKCRTDRSDLLRSYAMSRAMNGLTCECPTDNIRPYRSYTSINRTSERLVFIDVFSRTRWIDGSFCPIEDIKAEPLKWSISNNMNITARHGSGVNISLADGHCEYLKWKDSRSEQLSEWEVCAIEASANNADLPRLVELIKGK